MRFEGDEDKVFRNYVIQLYNYKLVTATEYNDIIKRIDRKHVRMLNRNYPQR